MNREARRAGRLARMDNPSVGASHGPGARAAHPADFAQFVAGEVLVASATAPAWTPLERTPREPAVQDCAARSRDALGSQGRELMRLRINTV